MGRRRRKKRRIMGVHVVPTFVSLANILCGFASITLAAKAARLGVTTSAGLYALYFSAMCVCFAMVADLLDGRIARMTGGDTAFGAELDSLSDIVSFGIAPAALVKVMIDLTAFPRRTGWVLAAAYVAFAAMRLARYNVEKDERPGNVFSGLPSPAAAGAVVSAVLLYAELGLKPDEYAWLLPGMVTSLLPVALPAYMFVVGLLMVTRVPYSHLGRIVLSGRKPFPHLVILAVLAVFAAIQLEVTLFAGFTVYVVAGLVLEARRALAGKRAPEKAGARTAETEGENRADGPRPV
jgi:CDP-diacylglycerol--serine O-phosphatidyltransferase